MKIAIHTVIKNELDEYLKVWLDHHSPMVSHIFIFEDLDSHSHKHITDNYPNVSLLSVKDICKEEMLRRNKAKGGINQRFFIRDGVLFIQSKNEYDWCFTLDIDEFITLQPPYKAIADVLSDFLDRDAVILQWQNYGASGRIEKPDYNGRDYREFYTEKVNDSIWDKNTCANTKVCWNLNRINRWHLCGLHCCAGNWVKTNGKKERRVICYEKMYLAHYPTKSWEEFLWKVYVRGMHTGNRHRKDNDFFEINPEMMDKYDECMKFKDEYLSNLSD